MSKVSIIIPVYNSELYIKQCLDSVLSQTEKDIEIIIVDDGSDDKSPAICDEYQKKDDRVTVIKGVNSGVSHARNKGLEIASGEYILFLDSDDYIDTDTIEKTYNEIKSSNADMIVWNYSFVKSDSVVPNADFPVGIHDCDHNCKEKLIATTLCPLINSINTPTNVFVGMGFVWNKLFRADVIRDNAIRFVENVKMYEDIQFVCRYLETVDSVKVIDEKLHYYRVNEEGATLKYKPDIAENNRNLVDALDQTIDKRSDIIKDGYYCRIVRCLSNTAQFYCLHKKFKGKRIKTLKSIIDEFPKYNEAIKNVNHRYLTTKQKIFIAFIKIINAASWTR